MRIALALAGAALIIASSFDYDYHREINMVRLSTGLFSVGFLYNPRGVKGLAVWGAGSDEDGRPGVFNWTWR